MNSLSLLGFGTARADLAAIATMRKSLPAWAPADTPGHFLKHADEQTVLAVAAVDQAIRSFGSTAPDFKQWTIIAAPRFIGRIAGCTTLDRFTRGGGPAISPHVIPQHSLHSISGALSILLESRQPNFGVGGTGDSLAEGLLAALTFPNAACSNTWLVATGWDPEPRLDDAGQCLNSPACHAVALAFDSAAANFTSCGRLRLVADGSTRLPDETQWSASAAELTRSLAALNCGATGSFAWRLPWGGIVTLEACEVAACLPVAA